MMKSEETRSWLERARVDAASQPMTGRDVRTAASGLQRDPRGGWDPFEVWLHRVRWPRERRDGTEK
jgi:hypothetical protein